MDVPTKHLVGSGPQRRPISPGGGNGRRLGPDGEGELTVLTANLPMNGELAPPGWQLCLHRSKETMYKRFHRSYSTPGPTCQMACPCPLAVRHAQTTRSAWMMAAQNWGLHSDLQTQGSTPHQRSSRVPACQSHFPARRAVRRKLINHIQIPGCRKCDRAPPGRTGILMASVTTANAFRKSFGGDGRR